MKSVLCIIMSLAAFTARAQSSHDPASKADYGRVFDSSRVHELTIHIDSETHENMLADLTDILGPKGSMASVDETNINILSRDPKWTKVAFSYEGKEWQNVGMRFKGNSSLASLWSEGNNKLPFKFNIAKYEDQKFFGFKKITFAPNFRDESQIREAYVSELLRSEGIPVASWAFYKVYMVKGGVKEYWGLYTMIEEVDDGAMLNREFGSKKGNLYKPESDWTSFQEDLFIKANNEDSDYTDVETTISALLNQGPGKAIWRANLERVLDVQSFLKWLAINSLILNWDSYGQVAHNYYLYANPANEGRLTWIPWDHNFAMQSRTDSPLTSNLFHTSLGKRWPLISRLLADPIYKSDYNRYLKNSLNGLLARESSREYLGKLHEVIGPAIREEIASSTTTTPSAFDASLNELNSFLDQRRALAKSSLGL